MTYSKDLYFAAIVPPGALKQEVKEMKLEFKEKFGASHALKLPAHITLIPPLKLEKEQELPFLDAIRKVTAKQFHFPVKLKNFGHFAQRVIFLKVVDHAPVKELHRNLLLALMDFLPPTKSQNLHPHITLATRDLTRDNFNLAWKEFKEKKYENYFYATALTLFKHDGTSWKAFEDFRFSEKQT